jgi:FAD/FMN-containing dehydrogenase/Fe-S oxidoreductase
MASNKTTRARTNDLAELASELRKRVSGEVRFDPYSRILYSTDASIYQMEPIGVVIPRNVNDVLAVMELAKDNNVPVLPRGGGTSLAGQCVNHAIVVDFSKYLNRMLEINVEERWARVQPGIVLEQLNKQLAPYNLQYAPDPTSANRACVGGGIGNNTCGTHSIIHGKTIDHIKELAVVLADASQANFRPLTSAELIAKLNGSNLESDIYRGIRRIVREHFTTIVANYPKIMRRVSGYNLDQFIGESPLDLSKIVIGSEGTLCVVTEAKVNLVPRPVMTALSVLHFTDIFQACDATPLVLHHGPVAVEIMDKMLLDRCLNSIGYARNLSFLDGNPGAVLLVEFYGESEATLVGKMNRLKDDIVHKGLSYACVNLLDKAAQSNVWNIRKAGLGLLMSTHGDTKPIPFVEDTAVDPERLGEYVRRFDKIVRSFHTEAGYYGHASVGCLHIRPLISLKDARGIATMVSISQEISDLVREFGGAMSGEHGDGIVRGVLTEKMFGPEIYAAFRDIKHQFDPLGIMNPGKIIDCPPMTENLRYGPNYKSKSIPTGLDFSADTNYAGAVEMCNGMGTCRSLDGTMCPSYMVTREEEHSTRGRANLLRAAMSGGLPDNSVTSTRLFDALDLCLECKACKAECPSGVDMAKLKHEFLNQYYKYNRISLRNWAVAHINQISRLGSFFAPVSNWGTGSRIGKFLAHVVLGVHAHRDLPLFARQSFPNWFNSRHPIKSSRPTRGTVVLLNDTFMNYNYPEIGKAAVELLEALSFEVILANTRCCGRPMISKGLQKEAIIAARYNVDLLHIYASQGVSIVGCEPSCLLTFKDEYPGLLKDKKSRTVAKNSYMIEDFIMMLQKYGELDINFLNLRKKVLFHGHCHQKALVGTENSIRALRLPPSYLVEEVNSGCCGMAGSFGYEKEHYEISMKIGNQALFPAINTKGLEWELAVTGVSCKQQIEHATGRPARHLVEILREALPRSKSQ